MQRLEDEFRNMRNESQGVTGKITERVVTMVRSQGQGEQKESRGAEETATVRKRSEVVSPLSRAGNL